MTFGWKSKLRKTDDFSSVFRFKRVRRGATLDIFFSPNGLDFPRLGLVVPKRVLATAVERNRARRVLREAFRLAQPALGGNDVIVRVKSADLGSLYRLEWDVFLRTVKPCAKAAASD